MTDQSFYIVELLEDNNLIGESFELEFKSAKGGLPGSIWETYSAFANSEGGTLILGISEKKDSFYLDGLNKQQIQKLRDDFWNLVNNKAKISINLLTEQYVRVLEPKPNAFVLVIIIPPAEYKSKPVYIGSDPKKGTYKRNNSGDYHCTEEEVRQMIADALPQKPDARILEKYTLEDLDTTSLAQYRQLFTNVKSGHPYLMEDDKGLLSKIGGWRKDRQSNKEGLTVAGLLMFGQYSSIIEAFPDFHLDYQEITDINKRWSDRIFPDGTWEANIFQFYSRVWPKISNSLPKPFQLQDGQRKDEGALHEALREALVNSLVHADYSGAGGIVIKKHADSFEFSNPGNLLITVEQYYRGGISIPRNNSIQTMFILLGYGEKAGSGSSRILSAWSGQHWQKPLIDVLHTPPRVELSLRMESLLPQESIDNLASQFGDEIRNIYGDALVALITAEMEGSISNMRLQELVYGHSSEISKMLKELCNQGYLYASGKGRGTVYQLIQKPKHQTLVPKEATLPIEFETLTPPNQTLTPIGETLIPKESTLTPNHDSSSSLPRKLSRQELEDLVVERCQDRYYTAEEISLKVERSASYIKNDVLPSLIKQKKLERLYPETSNHPNQAYKSSGYS